MVYNDVTTGANVEGAQSVDEELCNVKRHGFFKQSMLGFRLLL